MFYYVFRKPLISFRIHPLFRVFKRWASWPRWLTLNVWCFWRRGCFLVVAEVKRSIETCRLKQSWVLNQREDHWTNLLKYWRHVGLRPLWFCRYEFRPQHHCIWLVCLSAEFLDSIWPHVPPKFKWNLHHLWARRTSPEQEFMMNDAQNRWRLWRTPASVVHTSQTLRNVCTG